MGQRDRGLSSTPNRFDVRSSLDWGSGNVLSVDYTRTVGVWLCDDDHIYAVINTMSEVSIWYKFVGTGEFYPSIMNAAAGEVRHLQTLLGARRHAEECSL